MAAYQPQRQAVNGGGLIVMTTRTESADEPVAGGGRPRPAYRGDRVECPVRRSIVGGTYSPAPGYEVNWLVVVESAGRRCGWSTRLPGGPSLPGGTGVAARAAPRADHHRGRRTDLLVLDAGDLTAIDLATLTVRCAPRRAGRGFALGCAPSICVFADNRPFCSIRRPGRSAPSAVELPGRAGRRPDLISTGDGWCWWTPRCGVPWRRLDLADGDEPYRGPSRATLGEAGSACWTATGGYCCSAGSRWPPWRCAARKAGIWCAAPNTGSSRWTWGGMRYRPGCRHAGTEGGP